MKLWTCSMHNFNKSMDIYFDLTLKQQRRLCSIFSKSNIIGPIFGYFYMLPMNDIIKVTANKKHLMRIRELKKDSIRLL